MSSSNQEGTQLLCLTVYLYKKQGLDPEEFRQYMTKVHAPKLKDLMVKFGIVYWAMNAFNARKTHQVPTTQSLTSKLLNPELAHVADYDAIVQMHLRDVDDFVRLKESREFKENVSPDHQHFADTARTRMSIGWYTPLVVDGKAV